MEYSRLNIDRVMRQVLNSGHMDGGVITRTVHNEPKSYSTYAPAAIAAIGTLTLPLMSRSVVVRMHRTLRTDLKSIEVMKSPEEARRLEALYRHMGAWAQTAMQAAQLTFDPEIPKVLRGRTADNWRVLISIADSFESVHWSKAARDAAVAFADGFYDAVVALLSDIRAVFHRRNVSRIKSAVLAKELHELEDGVGIWSAWRGESDDQAPPSGRGYHKFQFDKWWATYCLEEEVENEDNIRQLRASE